MTSSTTPKPGPGHECESWQIRRAADGSRYCAACGGPAYPSPSREGTDEQMGRILADIHLMEVEEELDALIHQDLADGIQ